MFPSYMSRPLVALLFTLAVLAGCAAQTPVPSAADHIPQAILYPTVEQWLDLQQDVADLSKAEVMARLVTVDKSAGVAQLYYFGILNQQLQSYGAWTVARDTFQQLQSNKELPKQQRQLAGLMRQYNQSRINGYARRHELLNQQAQLQKNLNQAEDEKRQLQQKIQALTDVEAAISTRRGD